jgi:hypothetical protein
MSMSKPPVLALGRAIILLAETGDYPIGPSQAIILTRAGKATADRFAHTA